MLRKLAFAAPLILATAAVLWSGLNLPPPMWIVKYGPWPGCEPTGEIIPVEGIEFVVIGPGIARIGSSWAAENDEWNVTDGDLLGRLAPPLEVDWGEAAVPYDEMPVHWVEFPEGFALAKTAITNAQYEAFDPSHDRCDSSWGDEQPAVNISWMQAEKYCTWLSRQSGLDVKLPSETEWEAACRSGNRAEFCFGDDERKLCEFAWYIGNSGGRPHAVATLLPNAWGLYDMHGNTWEWCSDTWHEDYEGAPTDGSARVVEGSPMRSPDRLIRGGQVGHTADVCRSAVRDHHFPRGHWNRLGFRPAMDAPDR